MNKNEGGCWFFPSFIDSAFNLKCGIFLLAAIYGFGLFQPVVAQNVTDKSWSPLQLVNGFARSKPDTTTFLFDAGVYEVQPQRVVVTGAFRNWSQDMSDPAWQLKLVDGRNLWILVIDQAEKRGIGPSTEFKFRIDDGRWMEPPQEADNASNGNLVHRPGEVARRMRAEILQNGRVDVLLKGVELTRFKPADFVLENNDGESISVARVSGFKDSRKLRLKAAEELDPKRVYFLNLPEFELRCRCRRDGWYRDLYSEKVLGAELSENALSTTFRLFAPRCTQVVLYLYRDADAQQPAAKIPLQKDDQGVWETVVGQDSFPGSHQGIYYDFTVHGSDDPGDFFYDTHPVHISDPYARVSVDSFGRCRVWPRTVPASPLKNGRPAMQDVIAYEVHVEDFTNRLPVEAANKGTFAAMITRGLKNRLGQPIGFDHLLKLGINVVHLMPVQEFLHYPDEVWQQSFGSDPYMRAAGVDQTNYQWGYRTTHAFAIETRFRTKGTEHGAQREQFRDLVQAFHDHDIAVIIDLVPNHTGENMDGRHHLFHFNAIDLPYYYRTNDLVEHIGPFGNEVKTEDRPMVRRWLIDQCQHLMDEFGIDGFRIDLAGQIDKQTLIALRNELQDDTIIYGEPWIAPSDPDVANDPRYGWYKKDSPITFFQDSARNAFKGPVSNPENKSTDRGYAGGNANERQNVQLALTNGFDDEIHPNRGINYLDIHDNWALADRFAINDFNGLRGVDERRYRIAAGLLMTSLGPVVLHGGVEFMRSKGSAELKEVVKHLPDGPLYFHGKSDTYNIRTANEFIWENIGVVRKPDDENTDLGVGDFAGMQEYWQGLIRLRNSHYGRVFRVGRQPPANYYRWILPDDQRLLGYVVDNQIMVLVNVADQPAVFNPADIDPKDWLRVSDGVRVDIDSGVGQMDWQINPAGIIEIKIPESSLQIFVRQTR